MSIIARKHAGPVGKFFKKQVDKYRGLVIPGFEGNSIHAVYPLFVHGIRRGSITTRASSIAFQVFLASLPTLIFFFSIIPYIPIKSFGRELMDLLWMVIPEKAFFSIQQNIDLLIVKRRGLPLMGFAIAMFFAVNAVNVVIQAFNTSAHMVESRTWWQRMYVAVLLVLLITSMIVASVSLIAAEEKFIHTLNHFSSNRFSMNSAIFKLGKWLAITALIFCGISFVYYLGPARHNHWRFASPGSWFATILTLLASLGFSYFANHYAPFNEIYGSIGTLMAILIWLNFNSLAMLLGFELNASIKQASAARDQFPVL
jgi:membrane protein